MYPAQLFSLLVPMLVFPVTPGHGEKKCARDFISLGGEFRTCIKMFQDIRKWADAREACKDIGADLIRIENQKKQDAIFEHTKVTGRHFWIGLHRNSAGEWVWLDDTKQPDFTNVFNRERPVDPTTKMIYAYINKLGDWRGGGDWALFILCEKPPEITMKPTTVKPSTLKPKTEKISSTSTTPPPTTTTVTTPAPTPASTSKTTSAPTPASNSKTTPAPTPGSNYKTTFRGILQSPQIENPAISTSPQACDEKDYAGEHPCRSKGFTQIDHIDTCVRYMETKMTWTDARRTCINDHSADLVRADNKDIAAMLAVSGPSSTTPRVYWIGLRRDNKTRGFQWLDSADKVTWFNWEYLQSTLVKFNSGPICISMDSFTGLWKIEKGSQKRLFICQQPTAHNKEPPEVKVENTYGSDAAYIGEKLSAACTSYLDKTLKFDSQVFKGRKAICIAENDAHISYNEDRAFIQKDGRCVLRVRKRFIISNVTQESADTMLRCCISDDSTEFSKCNETTGLKPQFVSRRPTLTVDVYKTPSTLLLGNVLTASCSAFVGSGGHLVWNLTTSTSTTEWRIGIDRSVYVRDGATQRSLLTHKGSYNGLTIISVVEHDDLLGPIINSTFHTSVTVDLNQATLYCQSYMDSDTAVNTPDKTVQRFPFQVLGASIGYELDGSALGIGMFIWLLIIMGLPLCIVAILLYKSSKAAANNKDAVTERHLEGEQHPILPEAGEVGGVDTTE